MNIVVAKSNTLYTFLISFLGSVLRYRTAVVFRNGMHIIETIVFCIFFLRHLASGGLKVIWKKDNIWVFDLKFVYRNLAVILALWYF